MWLPMKPAPPVTKMFFMLGRVSMRESASIFESQLSNRCKHPTKTPSLK